MHTDSNPSEPQAPQHRHLYSTRFQRQGVTSRVRHNQNGYQSSPRVNRACVHAVSSAFRCGPKSRVNPWCGSRQILDSVPSSSVAGFVWHDTSDTYSSLMSWEPEQSSSSSEASFDAISEGNHTVSARLLAQVPLCRPCLTPVVRFLPLRRCVMPSPPKGRISEHMPL